MLSLLLLSIFFFLSAFHEKCVLAIGREAVRVVCFELVRSPQQLNWVGTPLFARLVYRRLEASGATD